MERKSKECKVEFIDNLDIGIKVNAIELNTDMLYEKHKEERNKRTYNKFKKDYKEEKRKREQRELYKDLLEEFNERNKGGYGR